MSEADAQKFSTSRINRLLRPLRNRCISLATFVAEGGRSNRDTYSSRTSANQTDQAYFPPLSLLQPPMDMGSRIHFAKHQIDSLEMSRKVYAVRDCFQEVVSKTDGRATAVAGIRPRVVSLAANCSIVVGENMPCEVDANSDGVEDANFVSDIYEAVPLQYRRFALLSHAINLVLSTTIHDPTLLSILLDVTFAHGLLYESRAVLRALLVVALSPVSPGAQPPICHPTHSLFLLELRTRWICGGFPDQEFCRILVEIFPAIQSPEAWGCKAVHKLAQNICGSEFLSFMELAGGCTNMACDLDRLARRNIRATDFTRDGSSYPATRLWTRLHGWLDIACDYCITAEGYRKSSAQESDAVYAFLELSLSVGLHRETCSVDTADIPRANLQGAIVFLATHWLSSPLILDLQRDLIIKRLSEIIPRSSTYVTLITKTFTRLSLGPGQSNLQSFAAVLRSHGLLRLEASLWACALRYFELPPECPLRPSVGIEKIRAYRDRLIDLVDEAEHRCFGADDPPAVMPSSHVHVDAPNSTIGRLHCEWQWEATLRCWVRRDTDHRSAKKRKGETSRLSGGMQNPSVGIREARCMEAPFTEGSVQRRPSQSAGEYIRHTRGTRLPLQSSSSNFTSLLADAFSQRTALRDTRESKTEINPQPGCHPLCLSSNVSRPRGHQVIALPSDDLLDLFTSQASSSPPHH